MVSSRKRYGKNPDGSYSECKAKPENVGKYRCNHSEHVEMTQEEVDSINEKNTANHAGASYGMALRKTSADGHSEDVLTDADRRVFNAKAAYDAIVYDRESRVNEMLDRGIAKTTADLEECKAAHDAFYAKNKTIDDMAANALLDNDPEHRAPIDYVTNDRYIDSIRDERKHYDVIADGEVKGFEPYRYRGTQRVRINYEDPNGDMQSVTFPASIVDFSGKKRLIGKLEQKRRDMIDAKTNPDDVSMTTPYGVRVTHSTDILRKRRESLVDGAHLPYYSENDYVDENCKRLMQAYDDFNFAVKDRADKRRSAKESSTSNGSVISEDQ